MASQNEFKGRTEEAITTLKGNVDKIEKKVGEIDRKIWLILLFLAIAFAERAPSLVGTVLAWGN